MRSNGALRNETQLRHRSTQFIHNLSSCLSLAMSNRLSSRRPYIWSDNTTNRFGTRGSVANQSRTALQSLSPILNSSDTYICCSYSPRCFIIQKVKPSTLQSSLCTTSPNSCESATNSIQTTTHLLRAKRCTNHDRKRIDGNALDTEELTKKVENTFENELKTNDNKITVSQTTTSLNELPQKMNVCNDSVNQKNSIMISNPRINSNESAVNEESLENSAKPIPMNREFSTKSGEELRQALQQQLEYYFSRENLSRDSYLISQMDSDQYVSIAIISNFDQIKRLTDDKALVVDVLRQSPTVQVDDLGEKVRPLHKRCVLILREIPESTVCKDIEKLFSGANCPKFVSCEFAHNQSWYVTFESDEDAQRAYRYIREEIRVFPTTGKPIMARIKAKPIVHSVSNYNKNGFRPTVGQSVGVSTVNSVNNCISNTSNDSFASTPQPLISQQNFTPYANVPTVNFNSRICPPFYPPSMLQAWTPTTSACYDLSTVFVANGLAPHAFGTAPTPRPNYYAAKNSSLRNNNNSKTHINRKPHFNSNNSNSVFTTSLTTNTINSSNNSNAINGTISSSNGLANSSVKGLANSSTNGSVSSTDSIANNTAFNAKNYSNPKTTSLAINTTANDSLPNTSVNAVGAVAGAVGAIESVVSVQPFVPKTDGSAQSSSSCSTKSQLSQSADNSNDSRNDRSDNRSNSPSINSFGPKNRDNRNRMRKQRKEDNNENTSSHCSDSTSAPKHMTTKLMSSASHNEPFELKDTLFPPLPSSANICSNDNKECEDKDLCSQCVSTQCSSLADVVKGTVKNSNTSNGSKSECSANCAAIAVHNVTNVSICQKSSKESLQLKTNCRKIDINSNTEDTICPNNTEEVIKSRMNSNSNSNIKVTQTSHDCHTNANPAKNPNPCPLDSPSSSCSGSELLSSECHQTNQLKDKTSAMSTPIVLNGINDSFSINSDSFDSNNSHSSPSQTPQTQPTSPNCVSNHNSKANAFETNPNQTECNGNDDQSHDSLLDETSDSNQSSKRLTYSQIAQRSAKDKLNQNNEQNNHCVQKDKESNSSNSSTSSRASTHLSSNSSRNKLKTAIDHNSSRIENGSNRSFFRNKDIRHSHDVTDRSITSRVK